jgi:hypothetical protein
VFVGLSPNTAYSFTLRYPADANHNASPTGPALAVTTDKLAQSAPAAPVLASKTAITVTLVAIAGAEYSKDGGTTWQTDPVFAGLSPNTAYSFAARLAETETQYASLSGPVLAVSTDQLEQAPLAITGNEDLIYGDRPDSFAVSGGSGNGTVSFSVPASNGVIELNADGSYIIIGAGSVMISATKAAEGVYREKSVTQQITVAKRQIIATVQAANKVYDKTTTATVTISPTNLIAGDEVTATASGNFADANVGANKPVTLSDISLSGADAANYVAPVPGAVTANITPKVTIFGFAPVASQPFIGSALLPVPTVTDGLVALIANQDFELAYSNNVNVGVANVAITGIGNYAGSTGAATFSITPAAYSYTVTATQTIKYGRGLAAITVAPASGVGIDGSALDGTIVWYSDAARTSVTTDSDLSTAAIGDVVVLYWEFTPDGTNTNHSTTATTGQASFTITDNDPQVLFFATPALAKTYGDTTFTNALTHSTGTGTINYASNSPSVATVDAATGTVNIVGAGTVTITATASAVLGQWAEGSASFVLTVQKAAQPAPLGAPVLVSKTATAVTLATVFGAEYSKDGGASWQTDPVFVGLSPNTAYSFTLRYPADANHNASPTGPALVVTTDSASDTSVRGSCERSNGSQTEGDTRTGTGTPAEMDVTDSPAATSLNPNTPSVSPTPNTGTDDGADDVADIDENTTPTAAGTGDTADTRQAGFPWWILLLIALIALLVAGGTLWFILARRRKTRDQS